MQANEETPEANIENARTQLIEAEEKIVEEVTKLVNEKYTHLRDAILEFNNGKEASVKAFCKEMAQQAIEAVQFSFAREGGIEHIVALEQEQTANRGSGAMATPTPGRTTTNNDELDNTRL